MKNKRTKIQSFMQLSVDKMRHVCGEAKTTSNRKINFCPVSGTPLSDENITEQTETWYTYLCPGCGSTGTLLKEDCTS
jgi:hypothetical protein